MRKKILLVTFVCKPNEGSESGVGWNYINMIKKARPNDDIYVVVWSGEEQEQKLKKYSNDFNFIFIDLDEKIKSKFSPDFDKGYKYMEIFYLLWQKKAVKYIKKQYGQDYFDLIHHITFVSATLPSYFINLKKEKTKFIWGPINSNDLVPYEITGLTKKYILYFLKNIAKILMRNINPIFLKDIKKSDIVITNNKELAKKLKISPEKIKAISSIGVEKISCGNTKRENKTNKNVNIAFIGEFMPIKNYDLAVDSFIEYNKKYNENSTLYLIGHGNQQNVEEIDMKIKNQNQQYNIIKTGWITRKEVLSLLNDEIDILLFPTCEQAGMVIIEAQQHGIPVVGLDFGGPKNLTERNGAILVEISNRNKIIKDLSQALMSTTDNLDTLSKSAKLQSNKYLWENIQVDISKLYSDLL